MPKDTTAIETTNANKIFDLPVSLQPGQVNTMSFAQDSISEMNLTSGDKLEISFTDGSKVEVENFQELVNSAQSCGRDTIIQLSDNTIIYPEELNRQLAQGPVQFGSTDAKGLVTLSEPPAGQIVEKTIQPGKEYKMGFDMDSTASAAQAGQNLIVTFKDGGVLVMKNYFSSMDSELPPALTLADGSVVDSTALLTSCKLVETPSFAQTVADETAAQTAARKGTAAETAADAEPAAGEETAASGQSAARKASGEGAPDVEPAAGEEAVADIEPAAGAAGALSGGRGGYGFASEPGAVALNGLASIGAIGATSLIYNAPASRLGPTGANPAAAVNTNPFGAASQVTIDESGNHNISSKIAFDFGSDGPSTTVPPVQLTGDFAFGGSTGGALTSGGVPVVVTRSGNVYTGKAGANTVFTFTIQSDGTYTFVQNKGFDHADKADPNDNIILNFGVVGTDKDGDQAVTSVSVNILDDAPIATDDTNTVGSAPLSVTGNVLTNDKVGYDASGKVTAVTFNGTTVAVPAAGNVTIVGTYGTLVINADGAYTYTSKNTALGKDDFTYTMRDFDGDTDTAVLSVTVTDLDTLPTIGNATSTVDETSFGTTIAVSGTVSADFKGDTPGTITGGNSFTSGGSKLGGNLTSDGVAVVVTYANGVYTGKAGATTVFTLSIGADGKYTYTQFKTLDHADKSNPDDIINLTFGVTGTDVDGDKVNGTITINVKDDGPLAVADTGNVTAANPTITGNVTSNDDFGSDGKPTHAVTKIIFNGTTYNVPADGSNITVTSAHGKLTINQSGQYSYTSTTTTGGVDTFTYVIADKDGDTDTVPATSTLKITVDDIDYTPTVTNATNTVDETNLGPITVTGAVTANYFSDGPGAITGSNTFSSGGSKLGGNLTSGGVAVVVTYANGVYTGKAGNETIFTLTLGADGKYSFTQIGVLDHADKSNPDDVITLNFGLTATDADGDKANGTITINVKDDGPLAVADTGKVTAANPTITGNVTSNDDFGSDGKPTHAVTKVIFNGTTYNLPVDGSNVTITSANGKLTINDKGVYSYTSTTTTGGVDTFTYVIADKDGDTDTVPATSTLKITVDDIDYTPTVTNATNTVDETNLGPITVTGAVTANYFSDGPGAVAGRDTFSSGGSKLGGNLTSGGVAVVVTYANGVYTGKAGNDTVFTLTIGTDGKYSFVLNKPLDHADKTNPDDIINLNFGIKATDADGDVANGTITINVKDDGPLAVNDSASVAPGTTTITGNVTSNDDFGSDGKPTHAVTKVIFNGTTYNLPVDGSNVTITSANGKLTINDKGVYSYTATTKTGGSDTFTYVIADKDGDTDTAPATATLKITVDDIDYTPTVTNATNTVDETNLGPITVTGAVTANYFADGPGAVTGRDTFSSGGSKLGGNLTSGGVAVVVTYANGVYTGKAGNATIFTLKVNADGTYSFTQNGVLDHADKSNPDDVINLNFGIKATDADGDVANGTITINVKDDGPLAVADTGKVTAANPTITGNVTSNDDFGSDGKPTHAVTKVIFNGTTYNLPVDGSNVTITSANGKLTINDKGVYSYTSTTTTGGVDTFTYVIADKDGDTDTVPATSTLKITIDDIDYTPTVTSDVNTIDETDLGPITINDSVSANYFSDGAGGITGNNSFASSGSKTGGNLTSGGVAVVVTYANGVYTGKAGNDTVFTLTIGTDGKYTFVLNKPLDHADKTNPDDIITLDFGVIATDADGDKSVPGKITINVKDDGPTAVNDTSTVNPATKTVSGDVTSNDDFGSDGKPVQSVTKITFGGTTYTLPADGSNVTITTGNGKLVINKDGKYTYTSTTTTGGVDNFTYVIKDKDGDTDTSATTATLKITTDDVDFTPTVTSSTKTVDETNMNPNTSVTGSVVADYFDDAPGSITGNNSFSSAGSKAGGNLTSNGVAVVVTYANGVYTGKAGATTVFTLTIGANGSYTYNQFKPLDHADKSNPDDIINLKFGVIATDGDGDKSIPGTITINVKDDGPAITGSTVQVDESNMSAATPTTSATGKVTVDFGTDGAGSVTGNNSFSSTGSLLGGKLTSKGVDVTVTQTGNTYIGKAGAEEVFKLVINADGTYTYTQSKILDHADPKDPNDIITLNFGARATDYDGDTADTVIKVNVLDDGPTTVPVPSVAICVNNYEDNVFLPTAAYATVITMTADTTGQGNQTLKLVLSGLDPDWAFTPVVQSGGNWVPVNIGTYNAAAGTWTLELGPGENFDGKFYFKPNDNTDLRDITFTATVTENGQSVTQTDDFNIIVGSYDTVAKSMAMATNDAPVDDAVISKVASKSLANDNLPDYSSVIESDGDATQHAINNFVHNTSSSSKVSTSTSTATEEVTAHAVTVSSTPEEIQHQVQHQVA